MDDNETITIHLERVGSSYAVPTRRCLVCDCLERPSATIVNEGEAWLCRGCKSLIKKLIYGEETNG